MGILGAAGSARSEQENAQLEAQIAIENGLFQQQIAQQNAQLAKRSAKIEEDRFRRAGDLRTGTLKAKLAARGVQLTGSPLQAVAQAAFEEEQNALLIRIGGEARAREQLFAGDIAATQGFRSAAGRIFAGDILAGNIKAEARADTLRLAAAVGALFI